MKREVLVTGKAGFIGKHLHIGTSFDGDITDYKSLDASARGMKGIVHLAAVSNKRRCDEYPQQCVETNVMGAANVLDIALRRNMWVIFISTFSVTDRNIYSLSKLMGEELCRVYQQKGLCVKVVRLPIVYGHGDYDDKIVSRFIKEIGAGGSPKIVSDDTFYFSYVTDVARMIEDEVAHMYLENTKKRSLIELSEGIRKCLGKKVITR